MSGFLLINPRSGGGSPDANELAAAAAEHRVEARILREDDDAEELARKADADALGMAGGDGSLAAVATAALERGRPFVCIPFGTRNHFARDLGLDRDDPMAALEAFDGAERTIDVGRVGGRVFLNNVSLGVYAGLVHRRERHRRRRVALARARALWLSLRERHGLDVSIDGNKLSSRLLLVANNAYELDVLSLGERTTLDEGRLHLYVAAGFVPSSWQERVAERFTLDADAGRLEAAIDGEPAELETPMEFTIEPKALRVLLPRG